MRKRLLTVAIILFLSVTLLKGQFYDTGQDPASLKWEQIITPHFRIIYPADFSANADRYAALLEEAFTRVSTLYPGCKVRIPVIIHNYSMESNGYVAWAPKRMELFPLPGQDNLPSDPAEQLTIHETTHVLQMASLNSGFSRILSYFAGEQAFGLSALLVPTWAFEGDAVYTETALTNAGRGRNVSFMQQAKALAVSNRGIYGFDKMLLGSYKNFTPDEYVYGYLMMNHLRTGDPGAWEKAIKKSGSALTHTTFSLKKLTGRNNAGLFRETFDNLTRKWRQEGKSVPENSQVLNLPHKDDYVSHFSPYRIDSNRIISLKTSLTAPSSFVITDTQSKKEKTLLTTGYLYPFFFSCSGKTVVWAEQHPDPRWDNRNYSVIKRMNADDGLATQLTFRTRYAAPDISPDGMNIVAVTATPDLLYSLVILNAYDGKKMSEVPAPEGMALQRPAWSTDGNAITCIALGPRGEGIRTYYPAEGTWVINKPESNTDIIAVKMDGDILYCLRQDESSDNVYAIMPDGTEKRITESEFGISGFSVCNDELLISDYSVNGFNVSSASISDSLRQNGDSFSSSLPVVAPLPLNFTENVASDTAHFQKKPYHKALHLFNFHSWAPLYYDVNALQEDLMSVKPGFTLLSQNHLSTLISTIGYEYSDRMHYLHTGFEWRGWYPVIEADITYGGKQAVIVPPVVQEQPADLGPGIKVNLSISQPLYFSSGKFRQLVMPAIYIDYLNDYLFISSPSNFNEGRTIVTGRFYFYNIFRSAYRDIYPKWGQVIDARYIAAPWDKDLYSTLKYIRGNFYLPGLFPNHSLLVKSGYETQGDPERYIFGNRNPFPRGYENYISQKLFSFSADYTMPLFYPDLAAGSLIYLKRIRSSVFYDYARGWETNDYNNGTHIAGMTEFRSYGGELLADFFVLRFPFEISAGISGGYLPAQQDWFVSPVFSVNIYGTRLGGKR